MANGNGKGSGSNWTNIIALGAFGLAFVSGIWSIVNPKGDLTELKKEMADFKWQVEQTYSRKDLTHKDVERVSEAIRVLQAEKVDKDVYQQKIETIDRSQTISRGRVQKLEEQVNLTYSAKDALKQMQDQIVDLQRALRGQSK